MVMALPVFSIPQSTLRGTSASVVSGELKSSRMMMSSDTVSSVCQDITRTRAVYKACLRLIPHKKFTFGKMWLFAAQFEIRQKDIKAARLILVRERMIWEVV